MKASINDILDILRRHGIDPYEEADLEGDRPEIGEIQEGESVYSTSLKQVETGDNGVDLSSLNDDPRLRKWREELERIIETGKIEQPEPGEVLLERPAIDGTCAWYCPIHFYGHSWGIYIRESCILSCALDIARYVDWSLVRVPPSVIVQQLFRGSFYVFFLHEQFHHKVESLGFRLLVTTASDRYRRYKANVYRRTLMTPDCLEESLANADSWNRLQEPRYEKKLNEYLRSGLRRFLKASFRGQPPGYAEGIDYLNDTFRPGLQKLSSQMLDGAITPSTPLNNWLVAPNMITALTDITDDIYVVLPRGATPIFRPTSIDPGATVSTAALAGALTRHHGYQHVPGGKGSHIKLKKPGAPTIILPGNRPALSPGVVKEALRAIGGYPLSRLPDVLSGRVSSPAASGPQG